MIALLGGLLIGLSAVLMLLLLGRIAGISTIINSVMTQGFVANNLWRGAFLIGLFIAPLLLMFLNLHQAPEVQARPWLLTSIAGLLVGFGSVYGSGCTSGHGVCGLGSFSKRSLISVLTFMFTAFVVVFLMRHLLV